MGIIKVLTFIEEKFLVQISDDEVVPENFESIEAISSLIEEKLTKVQVN